LNAALLSAFTQQARHFLDKQRHAAGPLAHPLDHVFGEGMLGRDLADHLRDPGAIQRSERDYVVMRAQAPRRAEFGAGRGQQE
jgi:hypothetical protein